MQVIEIGYINTVDRAKGMASVAFPSKGNEKITSLMPVCKFGNEYCMPEPGQQVLVVKTGIGASDGIIIGTYWTEAVPPPVQTGTYKDMGNGSYIKQEGGMLELKDAEGKISITNLIKKLNEYERRIKALESSI